MTDTLTLEGPQDTAFNDLPEARSLVPTDRRLLPAPLEALTDVANLLAGSGQMVPEPFRNKPDLCMAVAYQAALWGTDPVATASKAYLVNGRIAYEAQLISALVRRHLEGPPSFTYSGAGGQRYITVSAKPKGGPVLTYTSPILGQITPKNSPLWKVDPDQQLSYYAIRAWARRHMPDVLLGIYAMDELQQVTIRDVTPPPPDPYRQPENLDDLEHVEPEAEEQPAPEPSGGVGVLAEIGDTKHERTAGANEQEGLPADLDAWADDIVARVKGAETLDALDTLWRSNKANVKALQGHNPPAAEQVAAAFRERSGELSD